VNDVREIKPEEFKPSGTIAVMFLLALLIALMWLWMYFGVFLVNSRIGGVVP